MLREATHAGSWYSADAAELSELLGGYLGEEPCATWRVRAVIAPHAGYAYSGETASWAFRHVDVSGIRRVVVLGPSHHHRSARCLLSSASAYRTPLGDVPVDVQGTRVCGQSVFLLLTRLTTVTAELMAMGHFETMSAAVESAEHSIEMHIPFLVTLFRGRRFSLVPVLVGDLSAEAEEIFGRILRGHLTEHDNLFVISSDFCHWGKRFGFSPHQPSPQRPIFEQIEGLDREAMRIIEAGNPSEFRSYLESSGNTICGRRPIGVLMHMLSGGPWRVRFNAYTQSSRVEDRTQSSVSYASALVEEIE